MRYAIGCTYTDPKTKIVSPPYLVTLSDTDDYELTLSTVNQLLNKRLLYVNDISISSHLITHIKTCRCRKGENYYLLKIDSLNFPYKVTNNKIKSKHFYGYELSYERILGLKKD